MINIRITGSGSYIPNNKIANTFFREHSFLDESGSPFGQSASVIKKFKAITGIEERRYADRDQVASDLAFLAGARAIEDAGIDPETLNYIIVAHNYGDVQYGKIQSDTVPSLATRVKKKLAIRNPKCVAYDLLFGCPVGMREYCRPMLLLNRAWQPDVWSSAQKRCHVW